MKKYLGVKLIEAEPMNLGDYNKFKGWPMPNDEDPLREGFKVKYSDDYISWSPKEAFEESYREISGLTFGLAIEALKKGFKVARNGWNGKSQYIELAEKISYINSKGELINSEHNAIGNKAIAFVGTSGIQIGWLASQADMLAEDWRIVE